MDVDDLHGVVDNELGFEDSAGLESVDRDHKPMKLCPYPACTWSGSASPGWISFVRDAWASFEVDILFPNSLFFQKILRTLQYPFLLIPCSPRNPKSPSPVEASVEAHCMMDHSKLICMSRWGPFIQWSMTVQIYFKGSACGIGTCAPSFLLCVAVLECVRRASSRRVSPFVLFSFLRGSPVVETILYENAVWIFCWFGVCLELRN